MRIVNREEFISMPKNTLFAKFIEGDSFGELRVKTYSSITHDDTYLNDFVYHPIVGFYHEYLDCDEIFDEIQRMKCDSSINFEFNKESTARDGLYEGDQLFVVFDKDDIRKMIDSLIKCI